MVKPLSEIDREFILEHSSYFEVKNEIKPKADPIMFEAIDLKKISLVSPCDLFSVKLEASDSLPLFDPLPSVAPLDLTSKPAPETILMQTADSADIGSELSFKKKYNEFKSDDF